MNRVVGLRSLLLLVAVIAVIASIPLSERLEFDQRLESFFADDHPDVVILHRSRREFGGDEFVIVAWTEDKLFQHDMPNDASLQTLTADRQFRSELTDRSQKRIAALSADLSRIPGVDSERTQNLAAILEQAPKIRSTRRAILQLLTGSLIGDDARTTSIVLTLTPEAEAPVSRTGGRC